MLRKPAAVTERPLCYGFTHLAALPKCKACPYATACAVASAAWGKFESLAQQRDRLEQQVRAEQTAMLSDFKMFFKYYVQQYQLQFGHPPWRQAADADIAKLREAHGWCLDNDIDPATYLTAQFSSLRLYVQGGGRMNTRNLVGAGAHTRWEKFVCNGQRIIRSVGTRTFEQSSEAIQILDALTEDEAAVASVYFLLWEPDFVPDWQQCIDTVSVSALWHDTAHTRLHLSQYFGDNIKYVRPLIRARVACTHASQQGYTLPYNLLVNPDWTYASVCAALHQHSCPAVQTHQHAVDGSRWNPGQKAAYV